MLPTSPANLQHGASAKSEDYENDAQEARRRLSLERPYSQSPTEAKVQAELEAKEAILHQMREQRRLEQEESTVKEAVAPEDDSVSSFFNFADRKSSGDRVANGGGGYNGSAHI